VMCHRLV